MVKIMYYDLETTGLDERQHGIHQFSGVLEIDGIIVEKWYYKVRPNPKAKLDPDALAIGHTTAEKVQDYEPMEKVYKRFITMMGKYVDKYDKSDKVFPCGYNSAGFDNRFLRAWFNQNGDSYFGSLFYGEELDVRVLAGQYFLHERHKMGNFKLIDVAKKLGIVVEEDRLHDALYDVELTRDVYKLMTFEL